MPNPAVERLLALQGSDGGFGAYPGQSSRTEATALAALGLHRSGEPAGREPAAAAFEWLRSTQAPSGAWPLYPGGPAPSWSTSLATLALSHGDPEDSAALAATRWLVAEEGRGSPWWVGLLFRLFPDRKSVELDVDLTGWPWAEDTFSWVEPTSYAMLALTRMRRSGGRRLEDRLDEAVLMLVDRACAGGGWNYGNTRVFDEDLWPYPDTTALALLALGDRPGLAEVSAALDAVPGMLERNGSILAHSLCALALALHGRDAGASRAHVAGALEDRPVGEIRVLAWAALALVETDDVLGVRDV